MKKLELEKKHLVPYLLHDLEGIVRGEKVILISIDTIAEYCVTVKKLIGRHIQGYSTIDGFKPIYHPLSDLTKEIEHNGEKFVPINVLYNLHIENEKISIEHIYGAVTLGQSISDYNKLLKWHFWIFDQSYFDEGIIIDINTLKT